MKLVGLVPVRNEAWVLGLSLRALLRWSDSVVVLDHASTDATPQIVAEVDAEHPGKVHVLRETGETWDEMRHRQRMLSYARRLNATHIAMLDADEILTGNLLPVIRRHVEDLTPGTILQLPGYNLRGGIDRYHANGIWGNRYFSAAFLDVQALHWGGDQFHHREPEGMPIRFRKVTPHGDGGIMHLWGASERRLIARHALYKMTERIRWPNKPVSEIDRLYSLAIHGQAGDRSSNWSFLIALSHWWMPYGDLMKHLHLDMDPWQEGACRDLLKKHGAERFAGLDLFGVVEQTVAA